MNIRYLFVICIFLLIEQHIWGDNITKMVHFSYSELMLDSIRGEDGKMYIKMSYPGTDIEENLGFPALPIKYVTISLPHTADDISLDVQCSNIKSSTVNRILYPIQEPQTTSSENIIGCPNIRVWMGIPSSFSASLTYDSNNYIISANGSITDAEIGIRNIMYANEDIRTLNFNPSQGPAVLSNTENNLITLTGKNCLPQILPMTIQNATLQGTHYIIVKDVICGKDVRIGTPGDVVFTEGSDYTFETNGVFVLTKNVEIRHGAKLEVIPSEINY